jgi:hypothetical protein
MPIIKVPGKQDDVLKEDSLFSNKQFLSEPGNQNFFNVDIQDAIKIEQKRDGISEEKVNVKEGQIVELTFQDDVSWYVDFNNLHEEIQNKVTRGGKADNDLITLSDSITVDNRKRGLGEIGLKSLRVLGFDLPSMAAIKFAEVIEDKLDPKEGLYYCTDLSKLSSDDSKIEIPKEDQILQKDPPTKRVEIENFWTKNNVDLSKPVLIFLHGTGSSTMGSFGGLMEEGGKNIWLQIQEFYNQKIFAFEHKSLSKSPLENALDLVRILPNGIRLHLVSHSRGGLIGEILARSSKKREDGSTKIFSEEDIEVFKKLDISGSRQKDIDAINELNDLFKKKNITVERLVRVACPAAGTTLASGRLDLYLNTIVNLMKKIPFLAGSLIYDFSLSFLLAAVKNRMSPKDLPGLEAMVPGSPLTRILNDPSLTLESDLVIISGSVQGGNIWQSFKVFLTNLYYRDDHDFVVNTKAMNGGSRRNQSVYVCREKGGNVNHFRYFSNHSSQKALLNALKGQANLANGFDELEKSEIDESNELVFKLTRSGKLNFKKPVVFVVPGIMGSHLRTKKGDKRIWVNLLQIASGNINKIAIKESEPKSTIEAHGLVESAYKEIVKFLRKSHQVYPFPYDWRLSIEGQANLLAKNIEKVFKQYEGQKEKPKIRILAHSMGGLVARVMIAKHKNTWNKITQNEGRLIMMGTPNGGSHLIPLIFMGKDRIIKILSALDLKHSHRELLSMFTKFHGLLQLLPNQNDSEFDYFDTDIWEKLKKLSDGKLVNPSRSDLNKAAEIKEYLKVKLDPDYVLYVAGAADQTPYKIELLPDDKQPIQIKSTTNGDGRVTWDTGIPKELIEKCWYMPAEHGELCNHQPSFDAVLELIEEGTTRLLPQIPSLTRGISENLPYQELELEQFPDELELEAAVLGFTSKDEAITVSQKIVVSISLGDLSYSKFPILIGHIQGDKIMRGEKAMNQYLNNKLLDRHKTGTYPGPINTNIIVENENKRPAGAIVVGLGRVGELNENTLKSTVYHAVMSYAFKKRDVNTKPYLGISSLLIGGIFSGMNIKSIIRSILLAVQEVNQRIEESDIVGMHPIREFEFVEMYEDWGIEAAKILIQLLEEKPLSDRFKIKNYHINRIPGVRKQVVTAQRTDWWHRLKVESIQSYNSTNNRKKLHLKFTSLTEKARAEVSNLPTQKAIVDDLIKQAVLNSSPDRAIIKAMFDMLVPNDFKKYSADLKNILWVVDKESAKYPWELLQDSMDEKQKPIAVRSGMLRQLVVSNYRNNITSNVTKYTAFVVGDTKSNLPPLPGAQKEATEVNAILNNNGFNTTFLSQADPSEIITSLFETDYQILHLAGHGKFDPNDIQRSGMVLGEDVYLTPSIINQLTNIPELVFINCCHLGKIGDEEPQQLNNRHELAANLGTQLIEMGIKAVIVAGWAIDDAAASTFAKTFYHQLFGGESFGESVQKAREITYINHSQSNTWGAYQCYGDPFFEIKPKETTAQIQQKHYVDPIEAIIDLENIANRTEAISKATLPRQREKVANILNSLPKKWLENGQILEAICNAYLRFDEFDDYERAIHYYELAKKLDKANYSIQLLERLAFVKTKYGVKLYLAHGRGDLNGITDQKGIELVNQGISMIDHISHIVDETIERLANKGLAYKRLAIINKNDEEERTRSLLNALDFFKRAYDLEHLNGKIHFEALHNLLCLEIILVIDTNSHLKKNLKKLVDLAKQRAEQYSKNTHTFWDLMAPADLCLLEILGDRLVKNGSSIKSDGKKYIELIKSAWSKGGFDFEKEIIEEHLQFILEMIKSSPGHKIRKNEIFNMIKNVPYDLSQIWTK